MPDNEITPTEVNLGILIDVTVPPEPILTCDFKIDVKSNGPVIIEIYDDRGNQVSRACDNGSSGPIGTIKPTATGPDTYHADICLCGIGDDTKIRIVVCTVDPDGECKSFTRTIRHGGSCPACTDFANRQLELVVDRLRVAVTKRVANQLQEVMEAFAPAEPPKKSGRAGKPKKAKSAPKKPGKRGRR